jgi:hypothetical protein
LIVSFSGAVEGFFGVADSLAGAAPAADSANKVVTTPAVIARTFMAAESIRIRRRNSRPRL